MKPNDDSHPTLWTLYTGERDLLWAVMMDWLTYDLPYTERGASAWLRGKDVEEKLRQLQSRQMVFKERDQDGADWSFWRWRVTKRGKKLL